MELKTIDKGLLESLSDDNEIIDCIDDSDLTRLLDTEVKHKVAVPTVG